MLPLYCVVQRRDIVFLKPDGDMVLLTLSDLQVPPEYEVDAFYAAEITIECPDGDVLTRSAELLFDRERRSTANQRFPQRFVVVFEGAVPHEKLYGAAVTLRSISGKLKATPLRDKFTG